VGAGGEQEASVGQQQVGDGENFISTGKTGRKHPQIFFFF
jgi:hypothetical protein